ncbi:hypothetical protein JZ751_000368 [Albula glossodonta]|uniref:Uncharacterized protein n=1 Tax=Albula glossodonta TaxID=121402 RepID=A0A8T2PVY5_9TELE|nr:hypothetical protein JZ751_000368 [Albula glossodonta]
MGYSLAWDGHEVTMATTSMEDRAACTHSMAIGQDAPPQNCMVLQYAGILTSSFVVRFEATRYVWKPERPKIDQTEKKHTTNSTAVQEGSCFVRPRPGQDPWVCETGVEEGDDHKDEQHSSNHRDATGQESLWPSASESVVRGKLHLSLCIQWKSSLCPLVNHH